MKRFFAMLLAFSLLAAAGPVAAQSPAPQPTAPQPQPSATPAPQPAERKPLILNLDEASRRQIMRGQPAEERTDGGAARGLPSLGEGARPLETLRSSPYPKSSDNLP